MRYLFISILFIALTNSCKDNMSEYEEFNSYRLANVVDTKYASWHINFLQAQFKNFGDDIQNNQMIFINTDSELHDSITANDLQVNKSIDFETETLIGYYTCFHSHKPHYDYTYNVEKDNFSNEYIFIINCTGFGSESNISHPFEAIHWFIIPKVTKRSSIKFEIQQKIGIIENYDISEIINSYTGQLLAFVEDSINKMFVEDSINKIDVQLDVFPMNDNHPNVMFSYSTNGKLVKFSNRYSICKFPNRIEMYSNKGRVVVPPYSNTNYLLYSGVYNSETEELCIQFSNYLSNSSRLLFTGTINNAP